jgi:hypothetical protein
MKETLQLFFSKREKEVKTDSVWGLVPVGVGRIQEKGVVERIWKNKTC